MKILLTGANGQLGRCFQDRLPVDWLVWATDSTDLDITDYEKVLFTVNEFQPDAIINAAAYTAVDKAESEPDLAVLVNTIGPQNLAQAAKEVGARLVHISTDYVFDGTAIRPYVETDQTNPLGVYGQTKLDGEVSVFNELPEAIIVRTAWVFSEYGNNFVKTMLRLANERNELDIVSDQCGCPTYAGDIANAVLILIKNRSPAGLYHYCGNKAVSWFEFARNIFEVAKIKGVLDIIPQINSITTSQYSTPAKRPAYSVLNCDKIISENVIASDWAKALDGIIKKLI